MATWIDGVLEGRMNVNDLLIQLDQRDTLLANDAASTIRELLKQRDTLLEVARSLYHPSPSHNDFKNAQYVLERYK